MPQRDQRGFISIVLTGLIVFVLGLIALYFALPTIKSILKPPAPTYQPSSKTEFVDPKVIEENSQADQIVIIQPGSKALLPGAKWVAQSFNNCGPATTSMILQYFGFNVDQNTIKNKLRSNSDDRNVFSYEIADYLKSDYQIESKLLYNGDLERLKTLIANGFYILIEDYLHPNDDIGHFTIIRGFDDEKQVFIADDSYLGINIVYKYDQFDQLQWKPFNREYLPLYKAEQQRLLDAILGDDADPDKMFQKAVDRNQADINQNPNDMVAYFNLGSSYFGLKKYPEAKAAYEKSRSLGWPFRILWYQIQPIQNLNALGDYNQAIELANLSLNSNDSFAEAHLEKAIAYKGLGDTTKAREEANKALLYYPNFKKAQDFLASL